MSDQDGYHRLATLMTKDQRIAIFRRFDFVNLLGLLSLQAEIAELEADFRYQARADKTSRDPEEEMFSEWFQLLRKAQNGQSAQYEKLKTLRTKMKEYSTWQMIHRISSAEILTKIQMIFCFKVGCLEPNPARPRVFPPKPGSLWKQSRV